MKSFIFRLPYPISNNRYYRNIRAGRTLLSREGRLYYDKARAIIFSSYRNSRNEPLPIIQDTYRVHIDFFLLPKLTKKGLASRKIIDLDNCFKGVLDSFEGIVFLNDSQIISTCAEYGAPVEGGGVVVCVTKLYNVG